MTTSDPTEPEHQKLLADGFLKAESNNIRQAVCRDHEVCACLALFCFTSVGVRMAVIPGRVFSDRKEGRLV